MRLYAGSSRQFITDTVHNQIAVLLKNAFFNAYGFNPSLAEIQAWRNSIRAFCQVIQYAKLLDHGIILEYQLPLSSLRLDCLVTGRKTLVSLALVRKAAKQNKYSAVRKLFTK